jgi:septal ring factor EnvC (AmiA/AmiB activator)
MNFIKRLFTSEELDSTKQLLNLARSVNEGLEKSIVKHKDKIDNLCIVIINLESENSILKKQIKDLQECKSRIRRYESRRLYRRQRRVKQL